MTDTTTAAGQAAPAGEPGPLDEMILASLAGPHARFAERHGRAIRFHTDVAPFAAMAGGPGRWPWDDLATLVGPGGGVALFHVTEDPPPGWQVELRAGLVQMIATGRFVSAPEPEARRLTRADVPAMLDLVERTQPGPFRPRTIELGAYLGIFDGPRLVAMAGERMRAGGYTEISAVCTDPAYRGRGYASRLMGAVAAGIRARGEVPILHAAAANTSAIRLYEQLGFVHRELGERGVFVILRAPELPAPRRGESGGMSSTS